jgi:hypothetical protein
LARPLPRRIVCSLDRRPTSPAYRLDIWGNQLNEPPERALEQPLKPKAVEQSRLAARPMFLPPQCFAIGAVYSASPPDFGIAH